MLTINKVLVVYMEPETAEGKKTIAEVRSVVAKQHCSCRIKERNQITDTDCKEADLIIAVGGDGTFLRAAQFNQSAVLMGVNLDPSNKVGFFACATRKDFALKFSKVMHGDYKLSKLPRIETRIKGSKVEFGLNEVYYGHNLPYKMCRYELEMNGKKEQQRSSGVLVGTGAGSHAWIKSAGGKTFSVHSKKLQYLVREPYADFAPVTLRNGFLQPGQEIKIWSAAEENILVVDGLSQEYKIPAKTEVKIRLAKDPVKVVMF